MAGLSAGLSSISSDHQHRPGLELGQLLLGKSVVGVVGRRDRVSDAGAAEAFTLAVMRIMIGLLTLQCRWFQGQPAEPAACPCFRAEEELLARLNTLSACGSVCSTNTGALRFW